MELFNLNEKIIKDYLHLLLKDKTTKQNIFWGTSNYKEFGEEYSSDKQITYSSVLKLPNTIFCPRVLKDQEIQKTRTRDKAEVFTPSWICNLMNNYLDEEWFGKKNSFNVQEGKVWTAKRGKIIFPPNKHWQDYIYLKKIEITCGEAPYLVSRYDTSTGELIKISKRIGLLDRKIRVINENTKTEEEWFEWIIKAYQSIYGYEYQGDNLLIARINLLLTFIDNMKNKWKREPDKKEMKKIINIITWNIFQMNGLTAELIQPIKNTDENYSKIRNWRKGMSASTVYFKSIGKENKKMKFDYCIGNPPYQILDGGAQASAKPVYQYFSLAAREIADVVCLIQPSRWMTGGKGLDIYRAEMLNDKHIKMINDFASSKSVFNNVDIKGGVCIYIRDKNYIGKCKCIRNNIDGKEESFRFLRSGNDDIFIREPILVSIKDKVTEKDFESASRIVSAAKAYGLRADTMRDAGKYGLPEFKDEEQPNGYKILGLIDGHNRGYKYLPKDYPIPQKNEGLLKYKVFVAEAYGCGEIGEKMSTPVLSTPGELCTETFLQVGPFETKIEAENCLKYIKTKFLRTLVGIIKQTQHTTQRVYKYVPLQDFTKNSDIDWTKSISDIDQQLYKKYGLSENEIKFIEEKVKSMDNKNNSKEGEDE